VQIDGGFFEFDEAAGPSLEARFDYRIVPSGDGVTVTWRDVSERYQAERERAHSEEMFRATVESMLDPVVILRAVRDDTGAIVDFVYFYFNDAAARPTRYGPRSKSGAASSR
jgi:PAS domain-containing protein